LSSRSVAVLQSAWQKGRGKIERPGLEKPEREDPPFAHCATVNPV
jgi:hypothetical protein